MFTGNAVQILHKLPLTGDPADGMYFVESGQLRVSINITDTASSSQQVTDLERGDYFGELALLTSRPRAATVRAESK